MQFETCSSNSILKLHRFILQYGQLTCLQTDRPLQHRFLYSNFFFTDKSETKQKDKVFKIYLIYTKTYDEHFSLTPRITKFYRTFIYATNRNQSRILLIYNTEFFHTTDRISKNYRLISWKGRII